jgi:hypothetical protein
MSSAFNNPQNVNPLCSFTRWLPLQMGSFQDIELLHIKLNAQIQVGG